MHPCTALSVLPCPCPCPWFLAYLDDGHVTVHTYILRYTHSIYSNNNKYLDTGIRYYTTVGIVYSTCVYIQICSIASHRLLSLHTITAATLTTSIVSMQ